MMPLNDASKCCWLLLLQMMLVPMDEVAFVMAWVATLEAVVLAKHP